MVLVSVILTTFGNPIFLRSSIKSVLNQTFKEVELIIVDDNDPNSVFRFLTEKIVSEFSDSIISIIYLKHDKNRNGAAARNTGFSLANGKYISFLDNDDQYSIDRLEKCYLKMEQAHESIAGVYTGCEFRRKNKKYNEYKFVKKGNFLIETLACTFMLCTGSNIFVRKRVMEELNGFDESFSRHQDYEFMVRLFNKYKLEAIPEILVIKNNENFNLPNVQKMIDVKKHFLNKYNYLINGLGEDSRNYIYKSHFVSISEHALRSKNIELANTYYKKAKLYGRLSIKEFIRKIIFSILFLFK